MHLREMIRVISMALCGFFVVAYIAAKIHFFTRYGALSGGDYFREHRIYWGGMAAIAFVMVLLERLFPKKSK